MERGEFFEFFEVRKGIYGAIVQDGSGPLGNAGMIDFGNMTVVFDTTQSVPAAEELRRAAKTYTGKYPSLVINSHCHNDHVFGNQVFKDATIISTTKTRSLIGERMPSFLEFAKAHPEYPQQLRQQLADESLDEPTRWELARDAGDIGHLADYLTEYQVTLPTLCTESNMHLYGTQMTGELFSYGGGHSPSDLMLYMPQEKVLFTGDIAFVGYHPSMKDGNPEQWIEILDKVLQIDFEIIVAGHGPVGNRTHVEQTKQYLTDLILKSTSSSEPDTVECIPTPYNEWRGQSVYFANMRFLRTRYGNSS